MIDKQTSKDLSGDYTYFHKVALFLHRAPVITGFGPLANPCLCVFADGSVPQYKWQILFMTVASGDYSFDAVRPYLEQLRPLSGYKLCLVPNTLVRNTQKRFAFGQRIFRCGVYHLDALMHSCVLCGMSQIMFVIQLGTSLGIHAKHGGASAMTSTN